MKNKFQIGDLVRFSDTNKDKSYGKITNFYSYEDITFFYDVKWVKIDNHIFETDEEFIDQYGLSYEDELEIYTEK